MSQSLKEGYLLVQKLNKRWKARWFVLTEDQLCCHQKKHKAVVINSLPLGGSSVVCPVTDMPDLNIQGLLKLQLPDGEVVLLQAGGQEDRDTWAHGLGAVIRSVSCQTVHDRMSFQDFRTKANVSEIIGAIQDPDAGVESGNHLRGGTVFKNCFTGKSIIDWLLRWSLVRNRGNGAAMGQALMKLGHIQEVDLKDGTSGISSKFSDADRLYRFTSINLGAKRNSYYDSTDSDSSSSDEDEDETRVKDEVKVKRGKPVKEAFLAKKKNLRKGWQVVKVTARDGPPTLQYFRATHASGVDDKFPSKIIDLSSCKVMEIVKPPSSKSSTEASTTIQGPKFRLLLRSKTGKTMTFKMINEAEKIEWFSVISGLCHKGGDVTEVERDLKKR